MRKPLTDEQKKAKRLYDKAFYDANKQALKDKRELYLLDNEATKTTKKNWYEANKTDIIKQQTEYKKTRRTTDFVFSLTQTIRTLISMSFKYNNVRKSCKTVDILGCSFAEFKLHIESKFEPWMNWDNKGLYNGTINYGWDIDHIIPLSTAITEEDIIRLNHWSNLQPLCSYTNRHIKRNK